MRFGVIGKGGSMTSKRVLVTGHTGFKGSWLALWLARAGARVVGYALEPRTGRDQFVWETTIGAERTANVHVHEGVSEDEFVAMREARDATLGMPKLILPSIQVNMRAGHLPEPDSNGVRYLRLPVDLL